MIKDKEKINELIKELDESGREGVALLSELAPHPAKFYLEDFKGFTVGLPICKDAKKYLNLYVEKGLINKFEEDSYSIPKEVKKVVKEYYND